MSKFKHYHEKEVSDLIKKVFPRFKQRLKHGKIRLTLRNRIIPFGIPWGRTVFITVVCPNSAGNPKHFLVRADEKCYHDPGQSCDCYESIKQFKDLKGLELGMTFFKKTFSKVAQPPKLTTKP